MQCVENCHDPVHQVLYEQPVYQTLQMFLGEMLCTFHISTLSLHLHPPPKGFLPVAFAWIRERRQTPPVHLPEEEGVPRKHPVQRLTGWKILLLWLPAACDLTGTTVRPPIFCRSRLSPSPLTVDEYRTFIHSRLDLSNDERCSRPFCRYSQCRILETPAVVLPVEHPALSPEIILTPYI